ncbi:MAG: ribonucleotide reductase N-terminal alpha domain-containing protein, partial [Thermodesulfobacteriota bacterium]
MSSEKLETLETNGTALSEENSQADTESKHKQSDTPVEHKGGTVIEIPEETIKAFGGDDLRARVFYEKYALRDEAARIVEKTPEDMWRRVAREI